MPGTLIIGYGNPDRQDDGAAWHVLQKLAQHFNRPISSVDMLEFDYYQNRLGLESPSHRLSEAPDLTFALQLIPEMAETLARYKRVCFIDTHTGAYPKEIHVTLLEPGYQASPFTHHLTPESCLALAKTLYGQAPIGLLISIRGYCFGYSVELSDQTAPLIDLAVTRIVNWVQCHPQ